MKNILITCFAVSCFLLGLHRGAYQQWPTLAVQNIIAKIEHQPVQFDNYGRLILYPGKKEIPCPAQTDKTAVLFAFGQSNGANHQGQRYTAIDNRVVNFFNGKCYMAASPLLGASGQDGEGWTLLGNKLIEGEKFDRVVIISSGIGGSVVKEWGNGRFYTMLMAVLNDVAKKYEITHVFWQQGEHDFLFHTTENDYVAQFNKVIDLFHRKGINAPIYISTTSFMPNAGWTADNAVTKAQKRLIDNKNVFAGADTDLFVKTEDRYDSVHLSGHAEEAITQQWFNVLTAK